MAAAVDEGLVAILEAAAAVTALVGVGDAARIYPAMAPASAALPLLVFDEVGRSPVASIAEAAVLHEIRYQVSAWAATLRGARTLADAVRAALDNYSGVAGGVTVAGITFEGESADTEPGIGMEAAAARGFRMDYAVWVKE